MARFYHVLSVSVVPSVPVESAMESNDVLMTCFLRCGNEGAMSPTPMMPETITPRVVAVCDAVNRSGVSSSSSASIFDVVRDSQILGSDTLDLSGTGEKMTMFPQAEECSKMSCTHGRCGGCARCQTSADVCEHWRLCSMGQQKIQALMSAAARTRSSLQPWTHRRETQMTRREM